MASIRWCLAGTPVRHLLSSFLMCENFHTLPHNFNYQLRVFSLFKYTQRQALSRALLILHRPFISLRVASIGKIYPCGHSDRRGDFNMRREFRLILFISPKGPFSPPGRYAHPSFSVPVIFEAQSPSGPVYPAADRLLGQSPSEEVLYLLSGILPAPLYT